MSYASRSGRAKTNPRSPRAFGVCDRCGFWYNLNELVWQHEWRGNDLVDIRVRVCKLTCLDVPFQLNRPLYLPPDPEPVDQPRVEAFAAIESGPQAWDQSGEFWDSGLDWDSPGGNTNLPENSNLP
jgi:hypothetical protein